MRYQYILGVSVAEHESEYLRTDRPGRAWGEPSWGSCTEGPGGAGGVREAARRFVHQPAQRVRTWSPRPG